MANVLNRTTLVYIESVHTPDYSPVEWLINPDLSLVRAVPSRYWKIEKDTVLEMTQPEKDAVDAAIKQAQIDSAVQAVDKDLLSATLETIGVILKDADDVLAAYEDKLEAKSG